MVWGKQITSKNRVLLKVQEQPKRAGDTGVTEKWSFVKAGVPTRHTATRKGAMPADAVGTVGPKKRDSFDYPRSFNTTPR